MLVLYIKKIDGDTNLLVKSLPFIFTFLVLICTYVFISFICLYFVNEKPKNTDNPEHNKTILASWVQIVPADRIPQEIDKYQAQASVRLVLPLDQQCPSLHLTGGGSQTLGTNARHNPDISRFPVKVCEGRIPVSWGHVRIITPNGLILNAPNLLNNEAFSNIVVIGDTGCRGLHKQKCTPPTWPFKEVAEHVSAVQGEMTSIPELVIHVGDYVYGATDFWANWQAEFFTPARAILESSPLVAVRGNHEACSNNAGQGWFLLLSPSRIDADVDCSKRAKDTPYLGKPYALDLGEDLRLIILDTANANEHWGSQVISGNTTIYQASIEYERQFNSYVSQMIPNISSKRNVWMLSHVPFWGIEKVEKDSSGAFSSWKLWPEKGILRDLQKVETLSSG